MQSTDTALHSSDPSLSPAILPAGPHPAGVALESSSTHEPPRPLSKAGREGRGPFCAEMTALGTQSGVVQQQTCVLDGNTDHGWGSHSGQVLGLQKSLGSLGRVPRLKPHAQSSLWCCYSGCDRGRATSSLGTALHS